MPHFRRIAMSPSQRVVQRSRVSTPFTRLGAMIVCAALLAAIGCENRRSTPAIDSSVPLRPATVGSSGAPAATTWDARLGPVLLVSGSSPDLATVIIGDSSRAGADTVTEREAIAIRSSPAVLIGRGDSVQVAILQEVHSAKGEEDAECTGWPAWRITNARRGQP